MFNGRTGWWRRPSRRRAGVGLTVLALIAGITGAALAPAAVTAPANGEVVRDDVMPIKESVGGVFVRNGILSESTTATLCGTPSGTAYGRVTIKRQQTGAVVFTAESKPGQNNRSGPWETVWNTTGAAPGMYTLTSEGIDTKGTIAKLVPFTVRCDRQTPKLLGTVNFEYRPWQHSFKDVFGGGTVGMNTIPAEFRFDVGGARSPIVAGAAQTMQFYRLGASVKITMPVDPRACDGNPSGCVPADALSCNPAAGCTPRLAFVNWKDGDQHQLTGLFDLQSKAFAAYAKTGGRSRVLMSAGTELDQLLGDVQGQLNQLAAKLGIDLPALLGTTVKLTSSNEDGSSDTAYVSLLRGLEMVHAASGGGPTGLGVLAPFSVGVGLIIHGGEWLGVPDLGEGKGSGYGYTVKEAATLPRLPGPLPAPFNFLAPNSKLKNIVGKVPPGKGTHAVALAVTTDPGEPNGLPVWLPLLSGAKAIADNGVDFLGYADDELDAIQLEFCLAGVCFGGGAMVGTGVALFGDNPLPIGFGGLPLIFDDNEALADLMDQVDTLVSSTLGNPAVQDALQQLTGVLDPITGPLLDPIL